MRKRQKLYFNVSNLLNYKSTEISASIFEMNTKLYHRDNPKDFDIGMNLDGLISKYQIRIPIKSSTDEIINKYQTKEYKISFPSELIYKTDVYIIDCIFNGFQTSVY